MILTAHLMKPLMNSQEQREQKKKRQRGISKMAMFVFLFVAIGAPVVWGAMYTIETLHHRKKSGWYEGRI